MVAVNNIAEDNTERALKLKGFGGEDITRYRTLRDECATMSSEVRSTVIEYSTARVGHMPLVDIAPFMTASSDETFGVEFGPACFK